jgi:hypothetical protein
MLQRLDKVRLQQHVPDDTGFPYKSGKSRSGSQWSQSHLSPRDHSSNSSLQPLMALAVGDAFTTTEPPSCTKSGLLRNHLRYSELAGRTSVDALPRKQADGWEGLTNTIGFSQTSHVRNGVCSWRSLFMRCG